MPDDDRLDRIEEHVVRNGSAIRQLTGAMGKMHAEMRETLEAVYQRARKDERVAHGMPEEPKKHRLRLLAGGLLIAGLGALAGWALIGRPPTDTNVVAGPTATVTTPGPTVTAHPTTKPTRSLPKTPAPTVTDSSNIRTVGVGSTRQPRAATRPQTKAPVRHTATHANQPKPPAVTHAPQPKPPGATHAPTHRPPVVSAPPASPPPNSPPPDCLVKLGVGSLLNVCV